MLLCSLVFLLCAPAAALETGDPAPIAVALDQDGRTVKLEELYKKGIVLVYFYPRAGTPGCTAQACSLRDAYQDLAAAGVTVIGVSTDSPAAQKAFREKHHLPFTLIADTDRHVLKAFQVPARLGMANREAFLIREGKIVWHDASASTQEQARDVLRQLKE